ncbi:LpxL/LpxP family acyltransferase [Spiribacter salinus]|uniref:Lipid A biosynthesis acyltransferase n=1 Tax=Spiribacter salinus TaxID=1335746 RepID=A0A540VR59_9GAMM|nr:lysophospholipid acyltransferase family protein [Spiribacter salinus]MBY5268530.1 lipid A biosynthesis acyltransferase [Spiribacter salinus]MDR9413967.1 lysophospholipid acyltransferase family protein [Spiribacter sp.]MDR9455579.1 lysophospholipid acyltransferase family protein [Spiribacter sp.]TQE99255.1 MAG: lipid A biosynthesis acyltransferase [Spiribacter salinus]
MTSGNPQSFMRLRYTGQWLTIGFLWLLSRLPPQRAFSVCERAGRRLSPLLRRRQRIARHNLQVCFPEKTRQEREALLAANSRYVGRALAEIALAWFGGKKVEDIPCTIRGQHHLDEARAGNRPVILLGGHFLCLELIARLLGRNMDLAVIYKPIRKQPLLDQTMVQSRNSIPVETLSRYDLRAIIKTLKRGTPVWYAGDQDYGTRSSVFVPFMGVPAATVTGLTRLTALAQAQVVPIFFNVNDAGDGYEVTFKPALEGFPTGSDTRDAQWMNGIIEQGIRAKPEQYLWAHRRFKNRPPGEPSVYPRSIK